MIVSTVEIYEVSEPQLRTAISIYENLIIF